MVEVGSGPYRYDLIEGWGTLPEGVSFGVVTGVVVDSQGRVIVCQQQVEPPVIVFDRDGNYLNSWGAGVLPEPHTMFIDSDDIIYIPDRVAQVAMKFTVDGEPLMELGNRGQASDTGCTENEGPVLRAGGHLRVRRVQELPGSPVLLRRQAHLIMGTAGRERAGRDPVPALPVGHIGRQRLRLRPPEQPDTDLLAHGGVHRPVEGP